MSDGSIQVTPIELIGYGNDLASESLKPMSGLGGAFTDISSGTFNGLLRPTDNVSVLPEGMSIMNMLKRNLNEFQAFLQDVKTGMSAIQSAATAMAVAYATTDGDSANTIGAVDFAFADGGTTPQGFPTKGVSTLEEQQAAADAAAGRDTIAAQAAANPNAAQPVKTEQVAGGTKYIYADGSSLEVVSVTQASPGQGSWTTTTTTVSNGKGVAQKTTVTEGTEYYTGNQTKTTTVDTRVDGGTTSATTSTTVRPDKSVSVTTSGTDAKGKSLGTTTVNTVAPPKTTPDAPPPDSVRALEKEYGTQGQEQYYAQYGQY